MQKNNRIASFVIIWAIITIFSMNMNFIQCQIRPHVIELIKEQRIRWPEPNQHGSIPVTQNGSTIFYWFFSARKNAEQAPLMIWLTGGPGCSTEISMFTENGPMKLNKETGELTKNPQSWNNNFNLVFVDQPIGTSWSEVANGDSYNTNEIQVAEIFYEFLKGFQKINPTFVNREFYIAGESYAGKFVPNIGNLLYHRQQDEQYSQDPKVNFKGVAIGDGWVSPQIQYPAYITFGLVNKLISLKDYFQLKPLADACYNLIINKVSATQAGCEMLSSKVINASIERKNKLKFNIYDITKTCPFEPFCYDWDYLEKFFKKAATKNAEGFDSKQKWTDCNDNVWNALHKYDFIADSAPYLTDLMENGIKVLAYHGENDFICNWIGGQNWTNAHEWSRRQEFNAAPFIEKEYGYKKCVGKFCFIKFKNAGHLVPMDQPELALKMIEEFAFGGLFPLI